MGSKRRLRFREDGTFTIVQLTDLHIHDSDEKYRDTLDLVAEVLDHERPDFVALTGDIIDGSKASDPVEALRRALRPIEERKIPWAAVFGNHDDEGTADRHTLLAVMRAHEHSLVEAGPEGVSGVGNYYLTVKDRRGSTGAVLYFLDSNAYAPKGLGKYGWIHQDQVMWYRRVAKRLAGARGGAPAALAFFHIPLPEYETVWSMGNCLGDKFERVCSPVLNSGLFLAMVEMGDVLGVFVGHDHINDYEGELHGIRLCYGRACGYGTYGREGMARGARVIRLREGVRSFETWLRLSGGERVDRALPAAVSS